MPSRQERTLIGPGRYREGDQLVAEVRIGSRRNGGELRRREKFPLGTSDAVMIAWQHNAKAALIIGRPASATRGTLAADVPEYLATIPEGKYRRDTAALLNHWIASPLGEMPRSAITQADVLAQLKQWIDAGAANTSCNHRLSRLRVMYRALDKDAPNPTDRIKGLPNAETEARDIPTRIVQLILDSLDDRGRAARGEKRPPISETKIRLRVMAWTGIGPATLRRVRPRDLDLKASRIYLRPRRKGKGAAGAWVALIPPAVAALRDFAAAEMFARPYSPSSMGKTWRVGIARATRVASRLAEQGGDASWLAELETLPPRCRPYDLRHSFASEMYRVTGDIGAVKELLQHASPVQTLRYTKGAVSAVVAAAILKAGKTAYAAIPSIPAPPAPRPARRLRIVRAS